MKHRSFALLLVTIITSTIIVLASCKKINEATDLGGGLIPAVDGITTFDTVINVEAYNGLFNALNDSQALNRSELQFLGRINNDPLFGTTDARMFLELKPTFYKFSFARKDSLKIDSIVFILDYVETYGDSTIPQTVNVYEIDQSSPKPFRQDTSYLIREEQFTYSNLLGSRTFEPRVLDDSIRAYQDTANKNQLRIRLDNSFGTRLLNYDTLANGAYVSDSAFKTKFKGFAVRSMSTGNAIMGFNLGGANTKLAVYYKYPKPNLGVDSAAVDYFRFTTLSAAANYVERDHSAGAISTVQGGTTPDPLVFIQNSPGSYATIKIPDLALVSNRLIHRAELLIEQVYDPSDTLFPVPEVLYLDASDPTITAPKKPFRTIPYDFAFDASGNANFGSFGSYAINKLDPVSGKNIKTWRINLSRYVQHIVNHTATIYDLRLFSPFATVEQYGTPPRGADVTSVVFGNSTIAKGRVRVAGGTPGSNPQRMRLRLIYSKI